MQDAPIAWAKLVLTRATQANPIPSRPPATRNLSAYNDRHRYVQKLRKPRRRPYRHIGREREGGVENQAWSPRVSAKVDLRARLDVCRSIAGVPCADQPLASAHHHNRQTLRKCIRNVGPENADLDRCGSNCLFHYGNDTAIWLIAISMGISCYY